LLSDRTTGFSTNKTPWLPVNKNYVRLNLEAQNATDKSHYKVYQQLTELRKNPTFQRGETKVAALSEGVLAFTRCLSYFRLTYCDFS
jgi:glycosidase